VENIALIDVWIYGLYYVKATHQFKTRNPS